MVNRAGRLNSFNSQQTTGRVTVLDYSEFVVIIDSFVAVAHQMFVGEKLRRSSAVPANA